MNLDERSLSKLRWRCRRGLLENDLFIERLFAAPITERDAVGITALMDLSDNDLLDLFLARAEPSGDTDIPEVHDVLARLRRSKKKGLQ